MPATAPDPLAVDLSGHPIVALAPRGTSAVVLLFVATDCAVSNRYVPEFERLQTEFAAQGVRFLLVFPNPADTAPVVREHNRQFAVRLDTALDTQQRLVQMAHAVATPEAAVFVPQAQGWHEVYLGRIDDRYLSFGHERPQAQHHDLELAIRAVLQHQPVQPPGGGPVGCAIMPLHP